MQNINEINNIISYTVQPKALKNTIISILIMKLSIKISLKFITSKIGKHAPANTLILSVDKYKSKEAY